LLSGNDEFYGGIRFANRTQGFVVGGNFYKKITRISVGNFLICFYHTGKEKRLAELSLLLVLSFLKKY